MAASGRGAGSSGWSGHDHGHHAAHDHAAHDHAAHDHAAHDHAAHDHAAHDHAAHDHAAHDHAAHGHGAHDHAAKAQAAKALAATAHADHDHAGHDHNHRPQVETPAQERRLKAVLALVLAYVGVEAVGGYLAGSLALMADAGHMFSDAVSLVLALVAMQLTRRPATPQRTFGFQRAEVLAAVVNASLLLTVAAGILIEATERWSAGIEVAAPLTMGIALGGLGVNLLSLWLLGDHGGNMNMRGAWLHVVSDALGSVGVIVAGGLQLTLGWTRADPVASAVIALLIVRSSWRLLREAVDVLMETAPPHIDVAEVRRELLAAEGVADVHDLHVWTISHGTVAMSGHVVPAEGRFSPTLVPALSALLAERFGISHVTIQIESPLCAGAGLHP